MAIALVLIYIPLTISRVRVYFVKLRSDQLASHLATLSPPLSLTYTHTHTHRLMAERAGLSQERHVSLFVWGQVAPLAGECANMLDHLHNLAAIATQNAQMHARQPTWRARASDERESWRARLQPYVRPLTGNLAS